MKDCNYYSAKEDKRFSNIVIRFNTLEDGNPEKEGMRAMLKDRTQILLYQLPLRNLCLTEDEASEIYIESLEDLDKIISSYTECKTSYNNYLTTVCRYRAMSVFKTTNVKSDLEESFSQDLFLEQEDYSFELFEREPFYGEDRPEIYDMDIKELIDYISSSIDGNFQELLLTPNEIELSNELIDKKTRKQMMIYLMSLPQIESPKFIESIARVMKLDSMVFSYFYALRFDFLKKVNEKWESAQAKANRHFKTLLRLRAKMVYETDSIKKKKLDDTYSRIYSYYIKKLEYSKRLKRGLNMTEISNVLGINRNAVSSAIANTRVIMKDILGEC